MTDIAYKIVDAAEWRAAVAEGRYDGAPVDLVLARRSRDDSIVDLISSAFLP